VTRKRIILLCASFVCAAAAIVLALLAHDVGRWPAAVRAGDVAATGPARSGSTTWSVDETLPFSPARRLLGLDDDLAYRRAAALFRRAYTRDPEFERSLAGTALRVRAETSLAHEIRTDSDRQRASAASNMLGILALVDAASAQTGQATIDRSVFEFQEAIRLDPANEQAKANLELLYQQTTFASSPRGRERLQRSAHAGASSSAPGSGY
jgi:hypothetical protein